MTVAAHLARQIGLDPGEAEAFGDMLAALGGAAGRDLSQILARLDSGKGLRAALDLPPETVDLLYAQAFAQFNAGQYAQAEALFRGLCLLAPQVVDHWLGLGICQRMAGQFDSARLAFDIALDLDGDAAVIRFHRCELACREKRWPDAVQEARAFHLAPLSARKQALEAEMQRLDALIVERRAGGRA